MDGAFILVVVGNMRNYRALGKPGMSVVLTVISLGTRVALAYLLSAVPAFGVSGIW